MIQNERSLSEVWSRALPKLRQSRLNDCFRYSGLIIGGLLAGTLPNNCLAVIGQAASTLAGIWAGLLGFVIAGYTIFTTMNPHFMLVLGKMEESHSKFSHLKVRLLVFTQLFITMFAGLTCFIGIYLLSLIYPIYQIIVPNQLRVVGCVLLGACFGGSISAGLTEIKILIFNLYDLTLTQVEIQKLQESIDQRP